MTGPLADPPDLPFPVGDPRAYHRFADALGRSGDDLGRIAGRLGHQSAGVSDVWRSVPSSARAAGRLDALADLSRTWRNRVGDASLAVTGYARALEDAQRVVAAANRMLASRRAATIGLPPPGLLTASELALLAHAQTALADLRRADGTCARALTAAAGGEGRGANAVVVRVRAADAAADASPAALARAVHAALGHEPPDLVVLEESIRALRRLADDPARARQAVVALGPDLVALRRLCADAGNPNVPHDAAAGFDASEMAGGLAVLQRAAATARGLRRPPHTDPEPPRFRPPPTGPPSRVTPRVTPPVPGAHLPVVDARELARVLRSARAKVGHPDRYRARPGHCADGAALMAALWRAAGVRLPPTAGQQFELGTRVEIARIHEGDLVFWNAPGGHRRGAGLVRIDRVGLYLGHGMVLVEPAAGHDVHLSRWNPDDPLLRSEVVRLAGTSA